MRTFNLNCYKILPLVYDESLSYYEVLCKLVKTTNDIITKISDYDEVKSTVENLLETTTDLSSAVTGLQQAVLGLTNNKQDKLAYIEIIDGDTLTANIVGDVFDKGVQYLVVKNESDEVLVRGCPASSIIAGNPTYHEYNIVLKMPYYLGPNVDEVTYLINASYEDETWTVNSVTEVE